MDCGTTYWKPSLRCDFHAQIGMSSDSEQEKGLSLSEVYLRSSERNPVMCIDGPCGQLLLNTVCVGYGPTGRADIGPRGSAHPVTFETGVQAGGYGPVNLNISAVGKGHVAGAQEWLVRRRESRSGAGGDVRFDLHPPFGLDG